MADAKPDCPRHFLSAEIINLTYYYVPSFYVGSALSVKLFNIWALVGFIGYLTIKYILSNLIDVFVLSFSHLFHLYIYPRTILKTS